MKEMSSVNDSGAKPAKMWICDLFSLHVQYTLRISKETYLTSREQRSYRTELRHWTISPYYNHLAEGTGLVRCSTVLYKFQNYKWQLKRHLQHESIVPEKAESNKNICHDYPVSISSFSVNYTKNQLLNINGMPFALELLQRASC